MIAVIDTGIGNVQSVINALDYVKADYKRTHNPDVIDKAEKIIFPGVGTFADGMAALKKYNLQQVLKENILRRKKPYLGICLGMQLLAERGKENGTHAGLGVIKGWAEKLRCPTPDIKLPHIGWNNIQILKQNQLFAGLGVSPDFYFVHSYALVPENKQIICAQCDYGENFTAAIHLDNIYGVQFHPEKSQHNGLTLLKNYVNI